MELTKHWAAQIEDYVIDLAWSPDGVLLAAAAASGPLSLFSSADGAPHRRLPGHGEAPTSSPGRLSPGIRSARLASGGQDGAVKLWDAAAGEHSATRELGHGWVEHLSWGPGPLPPPRRRCLSSCRGRPPAPWTPQRPSPPSPGGRSGPRAARAAAIAFFGGVRLVERPRVPLPGVSLSKGIHALAWSPDGRWLVSGNQDPSVHIWAPDRDEELHMSGFESKVRYLSFDPTSHWLATGGGRDASIWDCSGSGPEGREPAMLPHDAPVCSLAFQRAHGVLASGAKDGAVHLWSPERSRPLRATVRLPAPAARFSWSPDDRYLAMGTELGFLYLLLVQ